MVIPRCYSLAYDLCICTHVVQDPIQMAKDILYGVCPPYYLRSENGKVDHSPRVLYV